MHVFEQFANDPEALFVEGFSAKEYAVFVHGDEAGVEVVEARIGEVKHDDGRLKFLGYFLVHFGIGSVAVSSVDELLADMGDHVAHAFQGVFALFEFQDCIAEFTKEVFEKHYFAPAGGMAHTAHEYDARAANGPGKGLVGAEHHVFGVFGARDGAHVVQDTVVFQLPVDVDEALPLAKCPISVDFALLSLHVHIFFVLDVEVFGAAKEDFSGFDSGSEIVRGEGYVCGGIRNGAYGRHMFGIFV